MPSRRTVATQVVGAPSMRWLATLPLWRGTVVLGYHRIPPDGSVEPFDAGLVSATATSFAAQLRFLADHFDVVGVDALERSDESPGRRVVLTFDDGYRDNYEVAFPLLKQHGLPAAFFLTTGFLDEPRVPWWDELAWIVKRSDRDVIPAGPWLPRDVLLDGPPDTAIGELSHAYKRLDTDRTEAFMEHCAEAAGTGRCPQAAGTGLWMTWEMAAELRDAGFAIGGHTATHPILARADPARQRHEIEHCRRRLSEQLGIPMHYFAYPVGLRGTFDATTRQLLRAAGVKLAFSIYGGYARRGALPDHYDVPRTCIGMTSGLEAFRAALALPPVFAREETGPAWTLETPAAAEADRPRPAAA